MMKKYVTSPPPSLKEKNIFPNTQKKNGKEIHEIKMDPPPPTLDYPLNKIKKTEGHSKN